MSSWAVLLLGLMAGCGSLPTIVPDLARRNGPPVQIEGARGPLSMAQSKAILDETASHSPNTDIFDRHLALEESIASSSLTTGNQVLLLQDGPATYQAMLAAIMTANDHINMEAYILDDDEVGQRFAQALMAKQAQGVQVNLLCDSVGTFGTPAAFFEQLAASGIQVHEFSPVNALAARDSWLWNQRNHRKLLIVDGHTVFMGGINISSVYSGGSFRTGSRGAPKNVGSVAAAWRDTDLKLQGPVVADFQKIFLDDRAKQKGPSLAPKNHFPPAQTAGKLVVRAIRSTPEEPFSQIYATLLSAIGSAETSVRIANAYFVPDPQLLTTLEAAAQRGVDVSLILPSQTDSWLVFHTGRRHYERLLVAGVKIDGRRGVVLHSKVALIDGVWASVGSTNLDWRSFLHNHELNAVVLGADFGRQVQAMFDTDLAASDAIALAQWRRRGLAVRVKELFARTWEYWL